MAGVGPEGGRVSLVANYEGRRLVNTPLSLEACMIEGVVPEMLLHIDHQQGRLDPSLDAYSTCKSANAEFGQLKRDFIERKRRALVATLVTTRAKLAQTKKPDSPRLPKLPSRPAATAAGSVIPSPPRADLGTPRSSRRPHTSSSPHKPIFPGSFHQVELPPENTEVAEYFLTLKQQADADVDRMNKWQHKRDTLDARSRAVAAKRAETMAARSASQDARLKSVLQRAQERFDDKQRKFEETWRKEELKLQTVSEQRSIRMSTRCQRDNEARAKERAEKSEEKRVEAIRQKMERSEELASKVHETAQKERERRAFLAELQSAAHREQTVRAQRAKDHRTAQLEVRLSEFSDKRDNASHEKDAANFQKTLQREVLARQKQEVADFVRSHGRTSPTAPPPAWLEQQLTTLKDKLRSASTARGTRPNTRSDVGPPRTSRTSHSDRTFQVREPFSIGGSSSSQADRQAFASWMYQSY
jgi:chemotaxis protein histidine kinase CheA